MKFNKILPYAALVIALIGLALQYQTFKKSKCTCGEDHKDDTKTGMIDG